MQILIIRINQERANIGRNVDIGVNCDVGLNRQCVERRHSGRKRDRANSINRERVVTVLLFAALILSTVTPPAVANSSVVAVSN